MYRYYFKKLKRYIWKLYNALAYALTACINLRGKKLTINGKAVSKPVFIYHGFKLLMNQ